MKSKAVQSKWRNYLKLGLKALVTSVLVITIASIVGWDSILEAVKNANAYLLFAGFFVAAGCRILDAYQMKVILNSVGFDLNLWKIMGANSLSVLYGMVIPGDFLASFAKWAHLSAMVNSKSVVLSAILYNRIIILFVILVIGSISAALSNPLPIDVAPAAVTVTLLSGLIFWMLFFPGTLANRIIYLICARFPLSRHVSKLQTFQISLETFQKLSLRRHFKILMLSHVNFLTLVFAFSLLGRAVGVDAPTAVFLWMFSFVVLVRQLPLTIQGLGVREGILVAVLGHLGYSEGASYVLGLLIFSTVLMFATFGLGYQILLIWGQVKWRKTPISEE